MPELLKMPAIGSCKVSEIQGETKYDEKIPKSEK